MDNKIIKIIKNNKDVSKEFDKRMIKLKIQADKIEKDVIKLTKKIARML